MTMPAPLNSDHGGDTARLYDAHETATAFYRAQLPRNDGPVNYLRDRGLGVLVDQDAPWRIGFAPRLWTGLTDHLHRRGFTNDDLIAAGLAVRGHDGRLRDRFRDRIIFPIRDQTGRTVAFIGRVWRPGAATDTLPKYLNSPDTPIYVKGRHLFGLAEQRDRIAAGWPPVLVEGPTDSIAVWLSYARTGRTGLVGLASCGTALTATQMATAVDLPGTCRYGLAVAFDGDPAGRRAADRTHQLLAAYPDVRARGAVLTPGTDPADLIRDPAGRATLRATLERRAQPLLHLVVEHRIDDLIGRFPWMLGEVEGRLTLARSIAPLVAEQPPAQAVEVLRHVGDHVAQLTSGQPGGDQATADTLRCVVAAVSEHLHTTAAPTLPQPSRPGSAPPRQALPPRSAPGPPPRHPAEHAFPRPPRPGAATVTDLNPATYPSTRAARHRSR